MERGLEVIAMVNGVMWLNPIIGDGGYDVEDMAFSVPLYISDGDTVWDALYSVILWIDRDFPTNPRFVS